MIEASIWSMQLDNRFAPDFAICKWKWYRWIFIRFVYEQSIKFLVVRKDRVS